MKPNGILTMSEPGPLTAAGGVALYKLGAFGLGAGLAALVVMAMIPPRSRREMFVSLTTTLVFSLAGGSLVITRWQLHEMMTDAVGAMGVLGIVFACGLPAWIIVRALFAWSESKKDRHITEIVDAVLDAKKRAGL